MDWKDNGTTPKLMNNAENACFAFANRLTGYQIEQTLNLMAQVNPNVDSLSVGFNTALQYFQPLRNDL